MRNQFKIFVFFFLFFIGITIWLRVSDISSSWYWVFGLFIGFIFQRSRLCLTAAFRDLTLFGIGAGMKALLLMIAVINLIYFGLHTFDPGTNILTMGYIDSWGLGTAIGAFIFGIGMVIAGGCVSGTFMRIGEGYLLQLVTFLGLAVGLVLGKANIHFLGWLYLPESAITNYFSYEIALVLQFLVLGFLLYLTTWWERRV